MHACGMPYQAGRGRRRSVRRRPGRLALARGTFSDRAAVRAATVGTCARVRAHVSAPGPAPCARAAAIPAMVPRAEATGEVEAERRPGPGPARGEAYESARSSRSARPAPRARAAGRCLRLVASFWTADVTGAGGVVVPAGRAGPPPVFCTRARALVSRTGLALAWQMASKLVASS